MNTLGKSITAKFFNTAEDYEALRQDWAKRMEAREEIPAQYHLLYKALIGKDWRTGFIAGSNGRRLAFMRAQSRLRYVHNQYGAQPLPYFSQYITDEAPKILLQILDENEAYKTSSPVQ